MGNINRIGHHPELKPGCSFHEQYPDSPARKHFDKMLAQGILSDNLGIDRIRSVAPDFQHDRIGLLGLGSFRGISRDRRIQPG